MIWAALAWQWWAVPSGLFSRSETGYRASRIPSSSCERIDRAVLWLTNHADVRGHHAVGTNIANYMVSLAIVLGTGSWLPAIHG